MEAKIFRQNPNHGWEFVKVLKSSVLNLGVENTLRHGLQLGDSLAISSAAVRVGCFHTYHDDRTSIRVRKEFPHGHR